MEIVRERSQLTDADASIRETLRTIRRFVDYLEKTKRELCLESTRLLSSDTDEFIGPSSEIALAGIVHALNFLVVCRNKLQETDLVITTRALAELRTD